MANWGYAIVGTTIAIGLGTKRIFSPSFYNSHLIYVLNFLDCRPRRLPSQMMMMLMVVNFQAIYFNIHFYR